MTLQNLMNPAAELAGVTLRDNADPVTCFERMVVHWVASDQIIAQVLKIQGG